MQEYDIIIAGTGLAGLTLALELSQHAAFKQQRILLLDRDEKRSNDRTWCFWAKDEAAVPDYWFKRWEQLAFFSNQQERRFSIAPYRYYMVRGVDFYTYARQALQTATNFEWKKADIQAIDAAQGIVSTSIGNFQGKWVFNSALNPAQVLPEATDLGFKSPFTQGQKSLAAYTQLLQHFSGWVVRSTEPVFDPEVATLMDFRVVEGLGEAFVYVLPFNEQEALVEFTVFSEALYRKEAYTHALTAYIRDHLGLSNYDITEKEFGIIPMCDAPFQHESTGRVLNIGTNGGFVKASSGYTFTRTMRKIRALVGDWVKNGQPDPSVMQSAYRFRFYDSVLLRVLQQKMATGEEVFERLFTQLSPQAVLEFLDEDSTIASEIHLMSVLPVFKFSAAALAQITRNEKI